MFLPLPFLHLAKPLPRKTFLPSWVYEFGLLAVLLCRESVYHFFEFVQNWSMSRTINLEALSVMCFELRRSLQAKVRREAAQVPEAGLMILDLPELVMECILAKLSPTELCNMARVCRSLKERCGSDHLWKRHMSEKWGRIVGEAARRKWELQIAARRTSSDIMEEERMSSPASMWPLSWFNHKVEDGRTPRSSLPVDSLMSFYMALDNGRFTFPAQVYNRENGNAGFSLSCYDAEIIYNSRKDKFYARYPAHGKRVPAIEEVPWERIRAPSVSTSPHDLHTSDCLTDLNPGDHIEIQWRRNKEFPYGWWFGTVGHLEACGRDELHCSCNASDTIVLEFNHYAPGSSWRRRMISRKQHREDGDETAGFYGGIRKVEKKEEISMWMQFWPNEVAD